MNKKLKLISCLVFFVFATSGCASIGKALKGLVGGDTAPQKRNVAKTQVGRVPKKNYQRTDHESIQERSKLGADSGSLWIERGQGSYLFAQNTNRLIGDLVNVEIDGHAKKQIETKVKVIEDLINRIKAQQEQRRLAAQSRTGQQPPKKKSPAKPSNPVDSKFNVKIVPSKITEILKDGSYLVQGDQPFMIGKREYKLVVKGIVRQEDFDDQGISAETLLDPDFDIVTNRKKR